MDTIHSPFLNRVYMIEFNNVSFSYDATPEIKSLKDFSLTVRTGECILITGASGCGKSTLLRLLNGLIPEFYNGKIGHGSLHGARSFPLY